MSQLSQQCNSHIFANASFRPFHWRGTAKHIPPATSCKLLCSCSALACNACTLLELHVAHALIMISDGSRTAEAMPVHAQTWQTGRHAALSQMHSRATETGADRAAARSAVMTLRAPMPTVLPYARSRRRANATFFRKEGRLSIAQKPSKSNMTATACGSLPHVPLLLPSANGRRTSTAGNDCAGLGCIAGCTKREKPPEA